MGHPGGGAGRSRRRTPDGVSHRFSTSQTRLPAGVADRVPRAPARATLGPISPGVRRRRRAGRAAGARRRPQPGSGVAEPAAAWVAVPRLAGPVAVERRGDGHCHPARWRGGAPGVARARARVAVETAPAVGSLGASTGGGQRGHAACRGRRRVPRVVKRGEAGHLRPAPPARPASSCVHHIRSGTADSGGGPRADPRRSARLGADARRRVAAVSPLVPPRSVVAGRADSPEHGADCRSRGHPPDRIATTVSRGTAEARRCRPDADDAARRTVSETRPPRAAGGTAREGGVHVTDPSRRVVPHRYSAYSPAAAGWSLAHSRCDRPRPQSRIRPPASCLVRSRRPDMRQEQSCRPR